MPIRYLEASAESPPFDTATFDVVCCCDVLEHVDPSKDLSISYMGFALRSLRAHPMFSPHHLRTTGFS